MFLQSCHASSSWILVVVVFIQSLLMTHAGPLADFITGPRYINPWPVERTVGTGIPKAMKGTCTAGSVYTIRSVDDLLSNMVDLECIYNAGQAPNAVPLGPYYGTVLKLSTSDQFAPIISPIWKGKLISETRCPSPMTYGMNFVANRLRIAALLSVEIPDVNLAPGEYSDGRPALILDYTRDFGSRCTTPPGSFYSTNDLSLNLLNNVFPFNRIVDVVRVVGRQADGGVIYLGKSYLEDPFRSDNQAFNIAFWSIVNYDPLITNLRLGQSLDPLPNTFDYMEPGAFQILKLLSPVDNFLVAPQVVLERFFDYFDAMLNVLTTNIGMDIRRGVTRRSQVTVSRIEYLMASMASLLSRNPRLMSGLSVESVAEMLLLGDGKSGDNFVGNLLRAPGKMIGQGLISPMLNSIADVFVPSKNPEMDGASESDKVHEVSSALNSMATVLQLAESLRKEIESVGSDDKTDSNSSVNNQST